MPIYELGTFADKRPYFSMKLVKGQTLADLLAARSGPADDLPRFLSIFAAIAQTMAYSHTRGVIHRDLKPSNVMVGSFGEVQVMDWGLARVLPRGGVATGTFEPGCPASSTPSPRASAAFPACSCETRLRARRPGPIVRPPGALADDRSTRYRIDGESLAAAWAPS